MWCNRIIKEHIQFFFIYHHSTTNTLSDMLFDTETNFRILPDLAGRFLCLHGIWEHPLHSVGEHWLVFL
jgi:hypothetical protein